MERRLQSEKDPSQPPNDFFHESSILEYRSQALIPQSSGIALIGNHKFSKHPQ